MTDQRIVLKGTKEVVFSKEYSLHLYLTLLYTV
jgi:hypothetical protein